MWKNHKWKLLLSSAVILLPALFGVLVWDKLPQNMTTHWGANGVADGSSRKAFAVFVLPLVILAVHWLCVLFSAKDPGNREQNRKVFGLVLWITPVISLVANAVVYAVAFDREIKPFVLMCLLLGVMFVVIGNYLPKCRQNHTIGIKVKWTLENEENWNATHRIAGKIWFFAGLLVLVSAFLPGSVAVAVSAVVLVTAVAVPIVYSYLYYKKQLKEGTAKFTPQPESKAGKVSMVLLPVILAGVAVVMFAGKSELIYGEDSFTVTGTFWQDVTVPYDSVESIEFRETDSVGGRTFGFSSAKLLGGSFRNDEFGNYTRYSYTKCDSCVVLTVEGDILVLNGPDVESTKEIFNTLTEKVK